MKKSFCFLFWALLLPCISSAGPLEKGLEALQVFNYFEAKQQFEKAMKNRPAGACYGLSVIFHRNDNPFTNIDSAYKYILLSEKKFSSSEPKEKESLGKLGIDATTIDRVKETVLAQAFDRTCKENTIEAYDRFIKEFPHPALKKEAVALRNKLAFGNAKKINTSQAYKEFLQKYPEAAEAKEAKWLFDLSLFNTLTGPNTLETYEAFVMQYPKSPYRMQAEDSIFSFMTKGGTLEEYKAFLKKHPANHQGKKAWEKVYLLATSGGDPASYPRFLTDFPGFPDKPRVKDDAELSLTRFFLITRNGKWGYCDSTGKERIPCSYDWADDFSEGLAAVSVKDKAGYVSKTGVSVIPLEYDEANPFQRGFAIVKKNNHFGLLDRTGRAVLQVEFDDISYDEATGGDLVFRTLRDGLFRYYGNNGQLLAEARYQKAGDFYCGRAWVVKDGRYGFININGEEMIPASFEWVENFRKGIARIRSVPAEKNPSLFGLIDSSGKQLLPCEYDKIDDFSEGMARVVKDKRSGFVNEKGELIIPIKYDYTPELSVAGGFQNGLAKIEVAKKRGLIDGTGKLIVPCEFDDVRNFAEDLCAVKKGKWGYIDKNKKVRVPFQYEYAWDFSGGMARVKVKGKTGFINQKGELIVPAVYEEASDLKDGIAIMVLAGKKGVADATGKVILPCEYDEISRTGNGFLKLEKNARYVWYNVRMGKQVWMEEGFGGK